MPVTRANRIWTAAVLFLLLLIIAGGVVLRLRMPHTSPIEIILAAPDESAGQIYIGGDVNAPGYYTYLARDNISGLVSAAGGTTNSADLTDIRLYVATAGDDFQPQQVDINRAEDWLLEALPGIGEVLAGRIIAYREQHGPFRNTTELTQVEGITVSLYEKIKPLITVTE
ncbi:MAG: ComEA family DNA-binding protein [Dehalococcoidales bacterium]|nr:ComEA family DNA-binding protein [Dehalococcoidales bacterium]